MIQVKKKYSEVPTEYLTYIERQHYREEDFNAGFHRSVDGHSIFKIIKKKSEYISFKEKLIKDQGFICCYCNTRVSLKSSTSEHIVPISINKSLLAEYRNILIACNGGRSDRAENMQNQEQYPLYCDAHRANHLLHFSPLDIDCWSAFEYSITDGSVTGNNPEAKEVLEILNLDCSVLRTSRLEALSVLFDDRGNFLSDEELEQIWDFFWKRDSDGKHESFFFVVIQNIYNNI